MTKIDPVLMSIYQRVMPQIIAQSIIGVSPMTGPSGDIFKLKSLYRWEQRLSMTKAHYRTFLRVNDRPRSQTLQAFRAAGYPTVYVNYGDIIRAAGWCREQFGDDGFLRFSDTLVFKDEADATLFKMRWL
jgi:hypothetical protein